MAGTVDINECGSDFWAYTGAIDYRLERYLWHLEDEPKKDVITEIAGEFSFVELELARDKLFILAREKVRENPEAVSDDPDTNESTRGTKSCIMNPWRMIKRRVIGLISQDLCDIYSFLSGADRNFPTRILKRQTLSPLSPDQNSDLAVKAMEITQGMIQQSCKGGDNENESTSAISFISNVISFKPTNGAGASLKTINGHIDTEVLDDTHVLGGTEVQNLNTSPPPHLNRIVEYDDTLPLITTKTPKSTIVNSAIPNKEMKGYDEEANCTIPVNSMQQVGGPVTTNVCAPDHNIRPEAPASPRGGGMHFESIWDADTVNNGTNRVNKTTHDPYSMFSEPPVYDSSGRDDPSHKKQYNSMSTSSMSLQSSNPHNYMGAEMNTTYNRKQSVRLNGMMNETPLNIDEIHTQEVLYVKPPVEGNETDITMGTSKGTSPPSKPLGC